MVAGSGLWSSLKEEADPEPEGVHWPVERVRCLTLRVAPSAHPTDDCSVAVRHERARPAIRKVFNPLNQDVPATTEFVTESEVLAHRRIREVAIARGVAPADEIANGCAADVSLSVDRAKYDEGTSTALERCGIHVDVHDQILGASPPHAGGEHDARREHEGPEPGDQQAALKHSNRDKNFSQCVRDSG